MAAYQFSNPWYKDISMIKSLVKNFIVTVSQATVVTLTNTVAVKKQLSTIRVFNFEGFNVCE